MRTKLFFVFFIALFVMLGGCATTSSVLYPEFEAQSVGIQRLGLMTDFVLVRDVKGEVHMIDVEENKAIGSAIGEAFKEVLEAKGYEVGGSYFSAGRALPGTYKLLETPSENPDIAALPEITSPAYVDESLGDDADLSKRLNAMFRKLATYQKQTDDSNLVIAEAAGLNEAINDDTVLIVAGHSHRVAGGKLAAGAAVGMALLAITGTGFYTTNPPVILQASVLNARTGEVLWVNRYRKPVSTSGLRNPERMARLARSMLAKMPDKAGGR